MLRRLHPMVQAAMCLSVAIVAGLGVQAVGTPRSAPMTPPSPIVATVELPKVLAGLKEREAQNATAQAAIKALEAQAGDTKKRFEAEKAKIELMPDNDAKKDAAKKYVKDLAQADFDIKFAESTINDQRNDDLTAIYRKVCDSAAELAKTRGYHMVLSSDQGVTARGNNDELTRIISLKKMLYVDPTLDVTDELIAFMNNQFAVGGSAPAKK